MKLDFAAASSTWFSPIVENPADVVLNTGETLDVDPEFMKTVKETLKDESPLFVTFAIQQGYSKAMIGPDKNVKNRYWPGEIIYKIADVINESGLPSYLGHAKTKADLDDLPLPPIKWVKAAKGVHSQTGDAVALIKGYVMPSQVQVKELLHTRTLDSASIFGPVEHKIVSEQAEDGRMKSVRHVTAFQPTSVDLVRKGMEGMPTYLQQVAAASSV